MNLLFSPDRLLQSFTSATPPPSMELMRQWLEQEQHGLSQIDPHAWKALILELRATQTLDVGVYEGPNALHAKLRWELKPGAGQRLHLGHEHGELFLDPQQLKAVYLLCTSHLARPGLYLYDLQGRLAARICIQQQKDLWTLSAIQSKFAASRKGPLDRQQLPPNSPAAEPRVGLGQHTTEGSRLHQLQTRYCNARVSFLVQAAPHSASQISLHDLAPMLAHLSHRELQLDLLLGGPCAWQHHCMQLSEEILCADQLVLRDANSTLQLTPSSFAEFWLVRSPFRGSFSYSILAYNSALALGLVALLPKSHLALSVSHWSRFAVAFKPCDCPDQ